MKDKTAGFSFLEIMISIVVLSVALLALLTLQTSSVGTNYFSNRLMLATTLAQDKLEELKAVAWNDTQLTDTSNNFTSDADGDGVPDDFNWSLQVDHSNVDAPGGNANPIDQDGNTIPGASATDGFNREWNVANDTPAAKMKTLAVRVTWNDKRPHSVIINTVISEE